MKSMFEEMQALTELCRAAEVPHPACYECCGTGSAEDTLGNYRRCYCISDAAFRRRLDNLAHVGTVMVTAPKPPDQLTEWDL